MSEHFSRRLQQMILSVRPPTARVSALHQTRSCCVSSHSCRTPSSQRCHRQCRPSILRHACVFGQTVEQALAVGNHSDMQVLLRPWSGKTLATISTSHNIAHVYSARSRASRHALASAPEVDRMVLFDAVLFQVMKDIGMASVFSRSS